MSVKTRRGTGDYAIVRKNVKALVKIALGGGNDVVVNDGKNTEIDFANSAGNDSRSKMLLGLESFAKFLNYDAFENNAGIAISSSSKKIIDWDKLANYLKSNLIDLLNRFSLPGFSATSSARDVLDDTTTADKNYADKNSAFVNIYPEIYLNKMYKMGMTGDGDSYIDTTQNEEMKDQIVMLVGNYSGEKGGTASLTSGIGNDLIYAGDRDTIDAGTGKNQIYLSDKKRASTSATVLMNNGSNSITNMGENDIVITESAVNAVSAENGNIIFENDEGGITTIVGGGDGKTSYNISAAGKDYEAVVGNNVVYNNDSNYYNAAAKNASITASTSTANIFLNKEVAANFGYDTEFVGNIKYVNAGKVSGKSTLAGAADIDNVITASQGGSSLWGGGNSDDTLIGGKGQDTFIYMLGDGQDSIKNADSNDTVRLDGGMTLSDITKIDVTNNSVAFEFKDGGSLTMNTNDGTKFLLDGATYSYDKNSKEWQKK